MADVEETGTKPPYGSFSTFWNYLQSFKAAGLPPRIDRSVMSGKSGSDQVTIMSSLKFFGLIDEASGNEVLQPLKDIVAADDAGRKRLLGEMVRRSYASQLDVSADNGTEAQLHESFERDFKITGETRRKAATFFIHAAREAAIPLSGHFPKARPGQGRPGARKANGAKKKPADTQKKDDTLSSVGGDTYTVALKSGGTVALTVSVSHFALSKNRDDRTFVNDLIDALTDYGDVIETPGEPDDED